MALEDFYANETKNFHVSFLVQNVSPDITDDTVTLTLFNSGSGLIYSSSANVATSGSGGTAVFSIASGTIEFDIYDTELKWFVSASGDTHIKTLGPVSVLKPLLG